MKIVIVISIFLLGAISLPLEADSIPITFSLSDGMASIVGATDTTLTLSRTFNGTVLSADPGLNAARNPASYSDLTVGDLNTGFLNGTFNLLFANGDALTGNVFEDASAIFANDFGPFTLSLTFTGGSGVFADASGSASGGGYVDETRIGTASGSGTINTSAVPEPAPVVLLLAAVVLITARAWRREAEIASGN